MRILCVAETEVMRELPCNLPHIWIFLSIGKTTILEPRKKFKKGTELDCGFKIAEGMEHREDCRFEIVDCRCWIDE